MSAMEIETRIQPDGSIHLPEEFRGFYGQSVLVSLRFSERDVSRQHPRQPGSAKGRLTILSEDDEHLRDFQDYMQ